MSIRRREGRVRSKPPIWTAGYDRGLVGSLRLYRLDVHHSLEGEHVHALRSRERGCFLVVQDSMGGKNSVNNRCRIAKHFGRNEIEVALFHRHFTHCVFSNTIQTCRVPDQELAADGISGPV